MVQADNVTNSHVTLNLAHFGGVPNDPNFDNAPIINRLINDLPKDGGTIILPSGNWYINSPIKVTRSFVTIKGANDGWRSGVDPANSNGQSFGGAQIKLNGLGDAIDVQSSDSHRITGCEFQNFAITNTGSKGTGINVMSDNDHFVISGMAMKGLENPIIDKGADAIQIRDNIIAENKNGVNLTGASQQAIIQGNSLGGQPGGISLEMENPSDYNIVGNTIYPDASSNITMYNPVHGTITGNTLSSYTNGIINILPNKNGTMGNANVISGNQLTVNSWHGNGYSRGSEGGNLVNDTKWGVIHINGYRTMVNGNVLEMNMPQNSTGVLIMDGNGNRVADNIIDGAHSSNNARVVVNGHANDNIVSGTMNNNSFQNGNNNSNKNINLD